MFITVEDEEVTAEKDMTSLGMSNCKIELRGGSCEGGDAGDEETA